MHTAWQRLKMDTRDAQLRRATRKACNWLKRVRSAAVVRFFERHVFELEKQLRMGDQHGFFQNIKSVQLEETKKECFYDSRPPCQRRFQDRFRAFSTSYAIFLLVQPIHVNLIVNVSLSRILFSICPPVTVNILHFLVHAINDLGGLS